MKSTYKFIIPFFVLAAILSSCLKGDPVIFPNGANPTFLELIYNPNGGSEVFTGLRYFANASVLDDSIGFVVSLQGVPSTLGKDVTVTVVKAFDKGNDNYASDSLTYLPMPDSVFQILNPTVTIPAGQSSATVSIIFFFDKMDRTQNYALPITVTNDAGLPVAQNYGIMYLHTIGNPIAGTYQREWIRYNTADQVGSPSNHTFATVVFAPANPTMITVGSGTGVTYVVTFDKSSAGVLSNFKVKLDAASVTNAAITITAGPTIVTADPVAGKYSFNFGYLNSSGAARNITDNFVK